MAVIATERVIKGGVEKASDRRPAVKGVLGRELGFQSHRWCEGASAFYKRVREVSLLMGKEMKPRGDGER